MELKTTEYSLALQSTGDTYQLQLVPNEIKFDLQVHIGQDGKEVQLRNDGTYIQWKYTVDVAWTNLISIADLVAEATTKENITGIKLADSPEFANIQVTNLTTDSTSGGIIPAAEWTWLGATAKSVISVLTKIISKIYASDAAITFATPRLAQTLSGPIALDRCITQYNNYTMSGALELSVVAGALVEGTAEGVIIGNGTNTPTLSGITLWSTSASFVTTNLIQNHFMVWKTGDGVYIAWTQKN